MNMALAIGGSGFLGARWGVGSDRPTLLTRYVVRSTCEDFSFTHAKATRDFGY
jgi:hypothetical protein